MKELMEIRQKLIDMAEHEAMRLFRMAHNADKHGRNLTLVEEIRNEARWLHTTGQVYPERIVAREFEYNFKYAFR